MVHAFELNPTTFPAAKLFSFGVILNTLIPLIFLGITFFFLIYLLWGGINWIRAGDDKENLKNAQSKIRYAIFGYVLVLMSVLFVKLLGYITHITFPL